MQNNQYVKNGQGVESYDKNGRLRNKTIAFRVSPEEMTQIDTAISLSGMLKQEFYVSKMLDRDINVVGNCKIHKAVYERLYDVLSELKRIEAGRYINQELMNDIKLIIKVVDGLYMKKEEL